MRQSSSRIHRSKGGFRLKHVLQICLLLAICTWLIYQVKHSHDKKKAYEERISKISIKGTEKEEAELFDFGRKGLPLPLANNNGSISSATRVKDEDGDEGEQEQAGDEEAKRDSNDGIIELDEDRGDGENEQEEEFTGEDEKDGQAEEDALFDHEEREDSAQEAREENYKRDDASSAVAHDVEDPKSFNGERVIEDPQSGNVDNTTNNANATYDDGSKNSKNITLDHADSTSNVSTTAFNGSYSDSKLPEVESTKSENGSISTLASTEGSSNQIMELQSNTTMADLPVNNLEIEAIPAVNVSDTSPEYQNSIKLDEKSEFVSPVQDLNSAVNEISREEDDKISDKNEGQEAEIHHQNSTVIEA